MATLEEIVIQLTAETSQLKAELQSAQKVTADSASKMEKAIKEFSENSAKNTSFFQKSMATMTGFLASQAVLGAFNMVKDAAAGMANLFIEGGKAAAEEEKQLVRLANSLALSGNFSSAAQKSLEDYTSEMMALTGVADDAIASNLAFLSSITKLDAEGLKKAQTAALDLSAAIGVDLDTATKMVAKGIEGNVTAFQKYGIEIEKSSDKTQQFNNVVNALSTGAAAGQMKTFAGAVTGLQNNFGELFEAISRNFTSNPVIIAVVNEMSKVFAELKNVIGDNQQVIQQGLANALLMIGDILIGVTVAINTLYKTGLTVFNGLITAAAALGEGIRYVLGLLSQDTGEDPFAVTKQSWEDTKNSFDDNTLDSVAETFARIRNAGADAFGQIKGASEATQPTIQNMTNSVKALSDEFGKLSEKQAAARDSFVSGLLDQSAAIDSNYKFQTEMAQVALENQSIGFTEYQEMRLAMLEEQNALEQSILDTKYANQQITEENYNAASIELAKQNTSERIKLAQDLANKEKELNAQKLQAVSQTFGNLAVLAQSSNKELAGIGKAAAIAQATVDGYAAVQKALASAPPPFNFALAASVGVATAANIAKIQGVGFNKGINSVPGVGNVDSVPAMLTPGERVVPAKSNEDLTQFLQDQRQGQSQPVINNTFNFSFVVPPTREQAADIAQAIIDAQSAGVAPGFA